MMMDRFVVALLASAIVHLSGSWVVSIRDLHKDSVNRQIDVGLMETSWSDRWIDLPGAGLNENRIFEHRGGGEAVLSDENIKNSQINLPEMDGESESFLDDIWSSPSKIFEDFETTQEGLLTPKKNEDIQGPISERKVLYRIHPQYPSWAQEYGVEFEVKVKIWVLPSGEVSDAYVEGSSGYPEVDADTVRAMKKWQFNEVEREHGLQWGVIKFKFRLSRSE